MITVHVVTKDRNGNPLSKEDKEKQFNRALNDFKMKIKTSKVIKEYVEKQHFVKKTTKRRLAKKQRLFMSRLFTDY